MSKIYGIYDMKDNEQCMRVGTAMEITKFLGIPARSFERAINKNNFLQRRYKIYFLFEEG